MYQQNEQLGSWLSKIMKDKSLWRGVRKTIDVAVNVAGTSVGIPIDMESIRSAGDTTAAIQTAAQQIQAAPPVQLTTVQTPDQIPSSVQALNIPKEYLYIGGAFLIMMFMMKK